MKKKTAAVRWQAMISSLLTSVLLVMGGRIAFAAKPNPVAGQWNVSQGICSSGGTVTQPMALAVQPSTGNVFAAVQSTDPACQGIFVSGFGKKFVRVFDPVHQAIDVSSGGNRVFAATELGLWLTDNNALPFTWTQVQGGLPTNASIYMVEAIVGTTEVYATVDPLALNSVGGLYRSLNDGVTWTRVQQGLDAVAVARAVTCGENSSITVAAARSDRGGLPGGLWISVDSGSTWSAAPGWPTARAMDVAFDCFSPTTNNFGHLYATNGDGNVGVAVFRSTDFGVTFRADNQGIPTCCASTISPQSDPQRNFGTDVGSWSPISNGGAGMFSRSFPPRLGSAWHQFSTLGLPQGAVITDWNWAKNDLAPGNRYIAIVGRTIFYFQPQ